MSARPESPGPAPGAHGVTMTEGGEGAAAACRADTDGVRSAGPYDPERTGLPGKSRKDFKTTSRLGSGRHVTESLLLVEPQAGNEERGRGEAGRVPRGGPASC